MKFGPIVLGACAAIVLGAATAEAQRSKSSDGEPCCSILSVNLARSIATARDKAGKTFQFTARDPGVLQTLKVGQAVSVDFATGKVAVNGIEVCCSIVKPDVKPSEPCCAITAVDNATGIATATEIATGRVFRFEVKDKALLTTLKAGQKIFADFGSSKVRIHGAEPCCNIIGHGIN